MSHCPLILQQTSDSEPIDLKYVNLCAHGVGTIYTPSLLHRYTSIYPSRWFVSSENAAKWVHYMEYIIGKGGRHKVSTHAWVSL